MLFSPGQRVGGYEVVVPLGAGGMGEVYKVRNVVSDRLEAMKVVLPDLETEPEAAQRFLREIKVHARLQHENIAALHNAFEVGGRLIMILELLEGETVAERLRNGSLPLGEVLDLVSQTLTGLAYAHEQGVVHRDVKPSNLFLTVDGRIKIMDFGIARAVSEKTITARGSLVGSLHYMSPEQVEGGGLDARSDLYSLSIVLYECVVGKKPFEGASEFTIMRAHLEETPPAPHTIQPRVSEQLSGVVLRGLEKSPADRYQAAAEMRQALMSAQSPAAAPDPVNVASRQAVEQPAASVTPSSASSALAPESIESRQWIRLAGIGVAAAAVAFGVLYWAGSGSERGEPAVSRPPSAVETPADGADSPDEVTDGVGLARSRTVIVPNPPPESPPASSLAPPKATPKPEPAPSPKAARTKNARPPIEEAPPPAPSVTDPPAAAPLIRAAPPEPTPPETTPPETAAPPPDDTPGQDRPTSPAESAPAQSPAPVTPPAPPPTVEQVYAPAEVDQAPQLLQRVNPEYTDNARRAGVQGRVRLQAEIWPDGRAHNIEIVQSIGDADLDLNAARALRQWAFQPGALDGKAVKVSVLIDMNYRLEGVGAGAPKLQ